MRFVLDLLYLLAAAAYSPMVIYRTVRHNRYRAGWAERFGKISRRNPGSKCIWLHAVSVGEVNAAKTIIKELEKKFSAFEIVVSTTTDTGFARASSLLGENHHVFYFPFDFSWVMRRAFGNIRPSICLLMELEVWPNFVGAARRANVPVVVVNGRISDNSFAGYKRIRWFAKTVFNKITLILAQTDEYAQHFIEIGAVAESVVVTGSLKYDTAQIADNVDGSEALAAQLDIGTERLWVVGATGPGEEKMILDVYSLLVKQDQFADLRLVIVPRKPERFDEVAGMIEDAGFDFIRYSSVKNADGKSVGKVPVILGDTMGDLRKFYSLATVIFVGRSLVPMGGSDMMEAAALGKCTVFGPHAFNFRQTVDALLADDGAVLVRDEQELLRTIQKCLAEPDYAQAIARRGREVIRKNQGATEKSVDQIERLLNRT
ncbi:MAG: 3-deoxy-D-manno-octulosonic acid transferase [Planctomycetota bacterium]|jgi:3-deoxy-D-manno-octulosonic-acid transferase